MLHFDSHKSWKELLPSVFSWLETVKLSNNTDFHRNVPHIVPFTIDKSTKKPQTDGLWNNDLAKQVDATLQSLASLGNRSVHSTVIDETPFVFIQVSSVNTTHCQKSRQVGIEAANFVKHMTCEKLVLCGMSHIDCSQIFDGLVQGLYSLSAFKESQSEAKFPQELVFHSEKKDNFEDLLNFLKGTIITRLVADAPPNWLDSEKFAEIARSLAEDLNIKCTIMGREELIKRKMGAFASVAQGTQIDPKFITLEIKGKNPNKWLALVGKGLTFDAGGISLKPSAGMAEMKYDLCGGAAVLGAAYCLAHKTPPTNVVCVIGAVENMPGFSATRPGDVVKSLSGKTIEILNTDAEGRLVLADLLQHTVSQYKPDFIVDVATLTGAVLFALGTMGSAVMSNRQDLADYLIKIGHKQGEPLWQLPLWPELDRELKSDVADLKNIVNSSVKAGTISAGAFLKCFIEDTPWAHFDIAGTGWDCSATGFPRNGSSAFGVRTLVEACMAWETQN